MYSRIKLHVWKVDVDNKRVILQQQQKLRQTFTL